MDARRRRRPPSNDDEDEEEEGIIIPATFPCPSLLRCPAGSRAGFAGVLLFIPLFIFRCLQLNHATLRGGEDLLTSYPGPCLEFELIPKLSHLEEVHVEAKQSHAIPNADCSFFFQVPPGNKSARRRTRRTTTKMRRRPLACRPPPGTMPQRWRLRLLQAQKW